MEFNKVKLGCQESSETRRSLQRHEEPREKLGEGAEGAESRAAAEFQAVGQGQGQSHRKATGAGGGTGPWARCGQGRPKAGVSVL